MTGIVTGLDNFVKFQFKSLESKEFKKIKKYRYLKDIRITGIIFL